MKIKKSIVKKVNKNLNKTKKIEQNVKTKATIINTNQKAKKK